MLRVVLLGDHSGFRPGTPAGNYVALVARALEGAGATVIRVPGEHGSGGRSRHLAAIWRLVRAERPDVVLYYGHSLPTIVWCRLATWRRATRFVLHAVEWPPANRGPGWRAWASARAYARWAFRLPHGVVVISHDLERRVAAIGRGRVPSLRVPILVDPAAAPAPPTEEAGPYAVYCGDLAGYADDVHFLLRAFAQVPADLRLVLIGRGDDEVLRSLWTVADEVGVAHRVDVVTEVLPYEDLLARYTGASALLAPLWDDERSRARFPSKISDYLLSGRPVVASDVGEVAALLTDGVDAFLVEPGSVEAFGAAIERAAVDGRDVGAAGRETALRELGIERHGARMLTFFRRLTGAV